MFKVGNDNQELILAISFLCMESNAVHTKAHHCLPTPDSKREKSSRIKKRVLEFQFQLIFISFLEKVLYTSLYQQSDRQ